MVKYNLKKKPNKKNPNKKKDGKKASFKNLDFKKLQIICLVKCQVNVKRGKRRGRTV